MAVVLLECKEKSKGILVLKHLELSSFLSLGAKAIENLKRKYIIGMYFGFYFELAKDIPYLDFYLAEDNVINFLGDNSSVPRCNLNGYNFIHRHIKDIPITPVNDFIFIGSYSPRKNLILFLKALLAVSENPRVLVVVDFNSQNKVQRRIRREVKNLLLKLNNASISIIEVRKNEGLYLNRKTIDLLLQASRVLVIPSRSEGAARVVAEAKILGLDVISNKHMKGGTNNHLHSVSDYLFDGLMDLSSALEAYSSCTKLNFTSPELLVFNHDQSRWIFTEFIASNFGDRLEKSSLAGLLKLDMENLFQSHKCTLPRHIPDASRNDECYSLSAMYRLYAYLSGSEEGVSKVMMYARKELIYVKNVFDKADKFIKDPLYYISLLRAS